ncbi:MAG: hypothetical protein A3G34_05715 [Candidatus Lindowbacteria bacterium RIFCSPLOWO2_12_FULL_62_27]|nr:MAG: hypothetical protein A3I06_13380 [Candidatus Lindowbacteria bacterium RIFCSPLOWO2_02_FULL_62_12]OGH59918.1 MAG: hypothetical protein A3G34_05715 [Candidatus Lindowbacteria bacterium RIFCSPLOWO2_12_FULL_62_27]
MSSEHEEIDPIKSNPTSHKAIGVALMLVILIGLACWLKGDRRTLRQAGPHADSAIESSEVAVPSDEAKP